jgi:hypothetical protein
MRRRLLRTSIKVYVWQGDFALAAMPMSDRNLKTA